MEAAALNFSRTLLVVGFEDPQAHPLPIYGISLGPAEASGCLGCVRRLSH